MFPTDWDDRFAELVLEYKSGKRYVLQTTVRDARKRALSAINRRGVRWIKVTVPNDDADKARIGTWTPITKWEVKIADLPRTKKS